MVTGRVLDVDSNKGQINLSLKRSVVLAKKRVLFADVAVGQIIRGAVKSVQSFGVFVRLRNSDLCGLCHISEVSEELVTDLYQAEKRPLTHTRARTHTHIHIHTYTHIHTHTHR